MNIDRYLCGYKGMQEEWYKTETNIYVCVRLYCVCMPVGVCVFMYVQVRNIQQTDSSVDAEWEYFVVKLLLLTEDDGTGERTKSTYI